MSTLRPHWPHRRTQNEQLYRLTDRLHARTRRVTPDEIAATVSGWLAEIGVESRLGHRIRVRRPSLGRHSRRCLAAPTRPIAKPRGDVAAENSEKLVSKPWEQIRKGRS
jgi:hypothetical protein